MSDDETNLEAYTRDLAEYTRWLMVATVVSAVAGLLSMICTAAIAWYTADLRSFAAQQAKDTEKSLEQTRLSLDVASRQAVAAEAANLAQSSSAERQLRAYLTIERHDTMETPSGGRILPSRQMHMFVTFKNVGQTPAYKVTFHEEEALLPRKRDFDPPLRAPKEYGTGADQSDTPEASLIGAGLSQGYMSGRQSFSDADLQAFREGKKVYVYWGAIYYQDIFARPRYVRFCRYFADGNLDSWFACQNHNDAN